MALPVKKTVKKSGSNSIETVVTARLPNAVSTYKGVVVDITASHVVFQHQKPHSSSFLQTSVPLSSVIYVTGKKGKVGELGFINSGDVAKRTGSMEITSNGFLKVDDLDRNGAPRTTLFNPMYASAVASGLETPDASTGFSTKKSGGVNKVKAKAAEIKTEKKSAAAPKKA